ncbi:MAG: porin family protein [Deltaproteobacteria bacterium]|nr:porin family protein [Deltaproteobacteria bacterium]
MKPLALALVAGLALVPAAAHAGGYVGAGIGTSASVNDSSGSLASDSGHSGRIVVGERLSRVSIEGAFDAYGLTSASRPAGFDAHSLGIAAKLHLPLVANLDGVVRVGLEHTWLAGDAAPDLTGDGWTGGLGLEYRLKFALASASIWMDYSRHATTLEQGRTKLDATADIWTAGVSIGL